MLGTLEVSSKIHADLVLVAEKGFEHLIGGHPDSSKRWSLKFASEFEDLLVQLFDFLVVLEDLGFDVVPEIVGFVDLGVDFSAKLFQFLVAHAAHVWEWCDPFGENFLLFGGLSFGFLGELFLGFVEEQALELHFPLSGHLLVGHVRQSTIPQIGRAHV